MINEIIILHNVRYILSILGMALQKLNSRHFCISITEENKKMTKSLQRSRLVRLYY